MRVQLSDEIVQRAYLTFTMHAAFPNGRGAMREAIQGALHDLGMDGSEAPGRNGTDFRPAELNR